MQSLAVKRAQVEFHRFAALGEREKALAVYAEENRRRSAILTRHLGFCGPLSPFLEIGANVGHSSYLLANEFGAHGFALDISADALRQGVDLEREWDMKRGMVRIAGDASALPFADGSLNFVFAFQTLSQFMDMDRIFSEVHRVLAPGGVFFFSEEPIRRLLSFRLFRAPYYEAMKGWERKLWDWGLLGFFVKDVIGAGQEESFGIRQNHRNTLRDWNRLIHRHFDECEFELTVPERGWLESVLRRLGRRWDRYGSDWVPARLLGGTLAAFCRKGGQPAWEALAPAAFHEKLRCPDCHAGFDIDEEQTLSCPGCGYEARRSDEVYTLLRSRQRQELYPADDPALADFSRPSHADRLGTGWYELEGTGGNRYRWMGGTASVHLQDPAETRPRLRIRGFVHEEMLRQPDRARISVSVNGRVVYDRPFTRPGLTVVEADVDPAAHHFVELHVTPVWVPAGEDRLLTWNVSLVRLSPSDGAA